MSYSFLIILPNIFSICKALRNEQRTYATKISELNADLSEHKIVIENLANVDGDRKCYRYDLTTNYFFFRILSKDHTIQI